MHSTDLVLGGDYARNLCGVSRALQPPMTGNYDIGQSTPEHDDLLMRLSRLLTPWPKRRVPVHYHFNLRLLHCMTLGSSSYVQVLRSHSAVRMHRGSQHGSTLAHEIQSPNISMACKRSNTHRRDAGSQKRVSWVRQLLRTAAIGRVHTADPPRAAPVTIQKDCSLADTLQE